MKHSWPSSSSLAVAVAASVGVAADVADRGFHDDGDVPFAENVSVDEHAHVNAAGADGVVDMLDADVAVSSRDVKNCFRISTKKGRCTFVVEDCLN